jgi:outer membrane protein assembly factor BamB
MRHVAWSFALALAGVPLVTPLPARADGGSPEWMQDAHDAQRTGYSPVQPTAPWTFAWNWNGPGATAGSTSGHSYDQPAKYTPWEARTVTGGDFVYVPSPKGLYALKKTDGTMGWQVTGTAFGAAPAYDRLTAAVYAGGADGKLRKIDAKTGTATASYDAGAPIQKAVMVAGGAAYVVTTAGVLHKVATATMQKVWSFDAASAAQTPPSFAAGAGLVVFATADLKVHAVQDADGKEKWGIKPTSRAPGYPYEFEGGWPVVAEQHGTVFLRMNHGIGLIFGPGTWPKTNAEIRAKLTSAPEWKNLFALDLATGQEKFIPAVGPEGTEDFGPNPNLRVHSFPVIRTIGGAEIAYQTFRSSDTMDPTWDMRWDSHLGEMVLDDKTVAGYKAGDLRYVDFSTSFIHITDENSPLTMAGDTIFFSHWAATASATIKDRTPALGATRATAITVDKLPPILRANTCDCGDFDPKTHYSTRCQLQYDHENGACTGRYYGAPGFYAYYGVLDPPTPKRGAYSEGILPRYTYVSGKLIVVEGNGGDLMVLTHSGTVPPEPEPTPMDGGALLTDGAVIGAGGAAMEPASDGAVTAASSDASGVGNAIDGSSPGQGGASGAAGSADSAGGCGCSLPARSTRTPWVISTLMLLVALRRRRFAAHR